MYEGGFNHRGVSVGREPFLLPPEGGASVWFWLHFFEQGTRALYYFAYTRRILCFNTTVDFAVWGARFLLTCMGVSIV